MELLIAVLIAFGAISSNQATQINRSEAEVLVQQSNISSADMEAQAAIIGLEETDF